MSETQLDRQAAMVEILQAVLDLESKSGSDLTKDLPQALPGIPEADLNELLVLLKSSRCLEATVEVDADGRKRIAKITGLTTRGLRELQKSWLGPTSQHSCPTDGDDGRLGYFG